MLDYIYRKPADGKEGNTDGLARFCGSGKYTRAVAPELLAIGDWGLVFSGRTQREAILSGELKSWRVGHGDQVT